MVRLPAFDVYVELGVDTSADRTQIRAAYRRAAKETHPDVSGVTGATARMARINAARDVLLDPDRRAEYDRQHGLLSRSPRRDARPTRTRPGGRRRAAQSGGPDDLTEHPAASRARRGPPIAECPVCPWPDPANHGHCALGHEGLAPRFGGPRRFRLEPADHGSGAPFPSATAAVEHASTCTWFAGTRAGGAHGVAFGWGGPAEFPAVGRIRQRDGVTMDPEILSILAATADEAAVRDALAYAVAGRVILLVQHGDRVRSVVCGRHAYAVDIAIEPSGSATPMRGWCSCPSWRPSCKHILSTWLAWYYTRPR